MPELIISEKPSAAKRIAEALADTKPSENKIGKVKYYELTHKNKKIYVVCAVGHLYALTEKEKKGWTYPTFDVVWKPAYEVNKEADFTKDYIKVIEKIAKSSDKFTVATDYDQEGEVIGLNALRYACKQKSGQRMKFSTLTKDELIQSYENASKTLDKPQAEAGETRHFLDYFYGINLSRALTLAVKNAGSFKILSTGRVQGPTLALLSKREEEISKFKPEPFWEIEFQGKTKKDDITAWHKNGKIKDKTTVNEILKKTKGKKAFISSVNVKTYNQKQPAFQKLAEELLSKPNLTPNEGMKTDPAHPAIYPTGLPFNGSGKSKDLYELIVRRFLATFSDPPKRETITAVIDVNKEEFIASGTRTIEKGWHKFYGRFAVL